MTDHHGRETGTADQSTDEGAHAGKSGTDAPRSPLAKPARPITSPSGALKRLVAAGGKVERHPRGGVRFDCDDDGSRRWLEDHAAEIEALVTPAVTPEDRAVVEGLLAGHRIIVVDETDAAMHVAALIMRASKTGCIAVDTETAVRPEHLAWLQVVITKTGTVSKRQPKTGHAGAALDPLRSDIRLVQAWAGDGPVVLFDMTATRPETIAPLFTHAPALAMYNATFDVKFLIAAGIEPTVHIFDTMTACSIVSGAVRPGMADAATRYLAIEKLPKQLGASDWGGKLTTDQLTYAALDPVITMSLWWHQRSAFDVQDERAQEVVDDTIIAFARMELAGMPFDPDLHSEKMRHWQARYDDAVHRVTVETEGKLTAKPTPAELAAYIEGYVDAGTLADWPRTKTGKLSTDKKTLKLKGSALPGYAALADLSVWDRALANYGQSLADEVGADGRIHASFKLAGATTGRTACSEPNLQNQPKRNPLLKGYRDIFRAPPGRILLSADYSQIELRELAEQSGDTTMRGAFATGEDLHRRTARLVTGAADPTDADRSAAKACAFGLAYGAGPRGFADYANSTYGLDLDIAGANELIGKFFAAYPTIRSWQSTHARECKRRGYVETLGGRRWFFEWQAVDADDVDYSLPDFMIQSALSGYRRTYSLNHPIQGTCAEILNRAVALLDTAMRHLPARIVGVVHDEVVIETDDHSEILRQVSEITRQVMTQAWQEVHPDAPITGLVDITNGPSWGQQHKEQTPCPPMIDGAVPLAVQSAGTPVHTTPSSSTALPSWPT